MVKELSILLILGIFGSVIVLFYFLLFTIILLQVFWLKDLRPEVSVLILLAFISLAIFFLKKLSIFYSETNNRVAKKTNEDQMEGVY